MTDTIGSIDGPTHLAAVQRIAELEAECEAHVDRLAALMDENTRLKKENERLRNRIEWLEDKCEGHIDRQARLIDENKRLRNALERLLDAVETYSSGSLGDAEDQARDILEKARGDKNDHT